MKYKRIKRVISGLLSLVMIFGQIPLTAFADDNINLTPTEVREDTSVISKSFIYKGEKKTIYLANNEDVKKAKVWRNGICFCFMAFIILFFGFIILYFPPPK